MVEKVPSMQGGGTLWFTDLTTPDSLYIFPVLTGLTYLAKEEVCTEIIILSLTMHLIPFCFMGNFP
jgi:membrane protein insertase Oxa1/YidC/SpoIIIJ